MCAYGHTLEKSYLGLIIIIRPSFYSRGDEYMTKLDHRGLVANSCTSTEYEYQKVFNATKSQNIGSLSVCIWNIWIRWAILRKMIYYSKL